MPRSDYIDRENVAHRVVWEGYVTSGINRDRLWGKQMVVTACMGIFARMELDREPRRRCPECVTALVTEVTNDHV